MPAGGGDPKLPGDGKVVVLRPEFSRGNSDLWDTKDVIVALMDERDAFRDALAGAATFAAFKIAVAATPKLVVLLDHSGV